MVNFYPAFLSNAWRAWDKARTDYAKSQGVSASVYGGKAPAPLVAWDRAHPEPQATAKDVADHIDHIVAVAGHDHVGIGGDYDGIPFAPEGLEDVSTYPALFTELARRGYSQEDLEKISFRNMMRVMRGVEATSAAMADVPPYEYPAGGGE